MRSYRNRFITGKAAKAYSGIFTAGKIRVQRAASYTYIETAFGIFIENIIAQWIGMCRFVYNLAPETKITAWQKEVSLKLV